jgi:hypothetical protein
MHEDAHESWRLPKLRNLNLETPTADIGGTNDFPVTGDRYM